MAIKYTNKKRLELNRKVLFELKHVSGRTFSVRLSAFGSELASWS